MSKWHLQIFKGDMQVPSFEGSFSDFATVKAKIALELGARKATSTVIARVIGPQDAKAEELQELVDMGAHPTFPPR